MILKIKALITPLTSFQPSSVLILILDQDFFFIVDSTKLVEGRYVFCRKILDIEEFEKNKYLEKKQYDKASVFH